jgi:CheY-like chemotaxis protein
MKLNYTVLWIDDRRDSIEPIEESIKSHLNDLGFRLVVVWKKDGSEIESLASDPELDLILMDQNLGRVPGDELVKAIRQHEKFIEIILYSQDPGTNLRDKDAGLDGIYRTHRTDIENVLKRVIDRTIRKTQDLNVMRGLVIAETIDIENQIEHIMIDVFENKGQFFQEKVLDSLVYDFGKKWDFLCSMMNDLVSGSGDSSHGSDSTDPEVLNSLHKVLKKMDKEVLDNRNILAHSKVEYDSEGRAHLRGRNKRTKGLEPCEAWCRSMRKTLLKHEENLKQIHVRLCGEGKSRLVPDKNK